jgi:hypothetical protein
MSRSRRVQLSGLHQRWWAWAFSIAVLIAGIALYLVESGDWTWWLASASGLPFLVLLIKRGEQFKSNPGGVGEGGGPLTPP